MFMIFPNDDDDVFSVTMNMIVNMRVNDDVYTDAEDCHDFPAIVEDDNTFTATGVVDLYVTAWDDDIYIAAGDVHDFAAIADNDDDVSVIAGVN